MATACSRPEVSLEHSSGVASYSICIPWLAGKICCLFWQVLSYWPWHLLSGYPKHRFWKETKRDSPCFKAFPDFSDKKEQHEDSFSYHWYTADSSGCWP